MNPTFRPAAVLAAAMAMAVIAFPTTPASADTIRDKQWYLTDLKIDQAHRISDGAGVTVGLIDTGVNAAHRDLRGTVLAGTEVGPGASGDGRKDGDGHGTEMAGIIAGRGHGSGDGVLGIAPGARILPIRSPINTLATTGFMTDAVDFAIAHHVGVINMSFAFDGDEELHAAIRKAAAADIVLVAGTGNVGKSGEYPGRYPEVLAVGAYGRDGKIASFSVAGPQVGIAAPGVDIVTTGNRSPDDYYEGQGTSEATAIVSGAAALVRAKYPRLSAAEVVHRLTATADDAGAKGRDDSYGYGRLDIVKALTADVQPLPQAGATGAGPAAVTPAAAGSAELPTAKSPLLLVAILGGLVVLAGLVVMVVVVVRRRA